MTVSVEATFERIKIRFGGVLHLSVDRRKLAAVHAWHAGEKDYRIEFVGERGTVRTEYSSEAVWKTILSELDRLW